MTSRVQRLAVVLYDELAGFVERAGGTLTFTYTSEYLAGPRPTPLSLSMPLATTTYTNRRVEAHLRGLLPDNDDVRRRWATHFGLRDRDTFGLIGALGRDAAGAAMLMSESDYVEGPGRGSLENIDDTQIGERLRRLEADSTDWLGEDERWSLAGAQSKFALRRRPGGWAIAHGVEPSTHIVRFSQ